ncbi:MAG: TrlF family AAA-like ATPase [Solirubrobacterales bacterium]
MKGRADTRRSLERSATIHDEAPASNTYSDLLGAIDDQRRKIAFFEPVVFHAHSVDSHDWGQRSNADPNRNDGSRLRTNPGVSEFLDELAANYSVVCITDHMRSDYACRLAKAARARDDITVLPGVEISCEAPPSYGNCIHLLAVFPPEVDSAVIERVFAGQDLAGPTERTGAETVRFEDLRELRDRIHEEGHGLFILAHVENSKRGHRARFIADRGQSLRLMVEGKDLKKDLSSEYAVYLANLQPDAIELKTVEDQRHYAPFEADGKQTKVACVAPADHHSFEDYERPDTATYLKIPAADFRSAREALRFHETRVRLPGQITARAAPHLVGLRLISASGTGLFLDTTVGFSPNLTCVIGPRGSGKSTIVEGLRYVLARNPALTERAVDEAPSFANLAQSIQAANLTDTRLELLYERPDGDRVILAGTFDEEEDVRTRVFSTDGDDLKVNASAIATDYPVSIFSWSEIEVLGRQSDLQRDLVDRLLGGADTLVQRREAIRGELFDNRIELETLVRSLIAARSADSGLLGRYRQYRDAYNVVNTPEVAALFEDLDGCRARSELLTLVAQEFEALEDGLEAISAPQVAAGVENLLTQVDKQTQTWWKKEADGQLKLAELDAAVKESAGSSLGGVKERQATVAELQVSAMANIERVEQELRAKTQLDKEQELLRDQRELARERFEEADAARETYLRTLTELDEGLERRQKLLVDLATAEDKISAVREEQLAPLNERLAEVGGERLNITVQRGHLEDRNGVEKFLNEQVLTQERAGRYLHRRIAERLCKMARPEALSGALVAGDIKALGTHLAVGQGDALTKDEAIKLLDGCTWRRHDDDADADVVDEAVLVLLHLAEEPIDDTVSICLNDRAVDGLSPGQRSSAMLPLIALAERGPLIIDQPEDNLDNAMVGETLTRILADLKEQRQIIVTTHNPNIVVGGDAEQVIVLKSEDGHRSAIDITGSIDDPDVIDAVLTVMEGGREAFEVRSKRYGVPARVQASGVNP